MKWNLHTIFSSVLLLVLLLTVSNKIHSVESVTEEGTVEYIPEVYVDPVGPDDDVDQDFDVDASLAEVKEMIEAFDGEGSVNFDLETDEVTIEERVPQESESKSYSTSGEGILREVPPYIPGSE